MRNIIIIPARGGSQRLPNKNLKLLNNKPLISWTIEAAVSSNIADTIIVNTDSNEIAKIALNSGAEVPFLRPVELATNTASTIDVIIHTLDFYKNQNIYFDNVIILQPTSPLRNSTDIINAYKLLNNNVDAVVSVCETEHSPLWSNTLPENLIMSNFIKPEVKNLRSQDLPTYYRLNGAIYIAKYQYLIKHNNFIGNNTKAYIMPQNRSIDIDKEYDFMLAEFIMDKFLSY